MDKPSFQKLFDSVIRDVNLSLPTTIKAYVDKLQKRIDSIEDAKKKNEEIRNSIEEMASVIDDMVNEVEESFPVRFQSISSEIYDEKERISTLDAKKIRMKFESDDIIANKYTIPEMLFSLVEIPIGDVENIEKLRAILVEKMDLSKEIKFASEITECIYPTPKPKEPKPVQKTEPKPVLKKGYNPSHVMVETIESVGYSTYEENGSLFKKSKPTELEKTVRTTLGENQDKNLIIRYEYNYLETR